MKIWNCQHTVELQGGRHVDHVAEQVVKKLIEVVSKKNKGGVQIKPFQVGSSIVFIFFKVII